MRVLIIEDEDHIQRILRAFLERFGKEQGVDVHVRGLTDPAQGVLELSMSGEYYDLIALDVRMPKIGGDEIYDYLAREKPHLLDAVVFITAYRHELKKRFPGRRLRVLEKPFRYERFAKFLRAALNKDPLDTTGEHLAPA